MGAYLQRSRHGTVFFFRRKVPLTLRPALQAPQFYVSLGTSDRNTALILARRAATLCDELFITIHAMSKDKEQNDDLMRLIRERKLIAPLKEQIEELRERLLDAHVDHNRVVSRMRREHMEQLAAVARERGASTTPARQKSKFNIAEAIDKYLVGHRMKTRGKKRIAGVLKRFEDFMGATSGLEEFDQPRYAEWADKVKADARWDTATQKLYITVPGSMQRWHRNRGERLDELTAATLIPRRTVPAAWDRDAFTIEQLGIVFRHVAPFREVCPHWFWATTLTAFLGCRVEELAQADVRQDFKQTPDGQWYISIDEITGPGGHRKSVKSISWRKVPIHSELILHGFPAFLEQQRRSGSQTLFEQYWTPLKSERPDEFNFSHGLVRFGTETMKRLIADGQLPRGKASFFHSQRHTINNHLASKGVSLEFRCAITGHKFAGGVNDETYTKLRSEVQPKVAALQGNLGEYVEQLRAALKLPLATRKKRKRAD